jgi:hypothetical protein
MGRLTPTPPEQVLAANAKRWRQIAAKHEADAETYRKRAEADEARFRAWQLANGYATEDDA